MERKRASDKSQSGTEPFALALVPPKGLESKAAFKLRDSVFHQNRDQPWFFGYCPTALLEKCMKKKGDFGISYEDEVRVVVQGAAAVHVLVAQRNLTQASYRLTATGDTVDSLPKLVELGQKAVFSVEGDACQFAQPAEKPHFFVHRDAVQEEGGARPLTDKFGPHVVVRGRAFDKLSVILKKVYVKNTLPASSEKAQRSLINEATRLLTLKHPNIVMMLGLVSQALPLTVVYEDCPGGSLCEFVFSNHKELTDVELVTFALNVACALQYLHSQEIIHRSVLTNKCFIDACGQVKLGGFGLSATAKEIAAMSSSSIRRQRVALRILPPESLRKPPLYTVAGDIWAMGMFLFELFNDCRVAWPDEEIQVVVQRIREADMPQPPERMPEGMKKLLRTRCWLPEPEKRPSIDEVRTSLEEHLRVSSVQPDKSQKAFRHLSNVHPMSQEKALKKRDEFLAELAKCRKAFVPPSRKKSSLKKRSLPNTDSNLSDKSNEKSKTKPDVQETGSMKTKKKTVRQNSSKPNTACKATPPPKPRLPRPPKAHDPIDDDCSVTMKK